MGMSLSNIFYMYFCYAANSNAASTESNSDSISCTNPSQANLDSVSEKTSTSNPNWLHASGWKSSIFGDNDADEFIKNIDPAIVLEAGEKLLKDLETKIIPKLKIFQNSKNVEVV